MEAAARSVFPWWAVNGSSLVGARLGGAVMADGCQGHDPADRGRGSVLTASDPSSLRGPGDGTPLPLPTGNGAP